MDKNKNRNTELIMEEGSNSCFQDCLQLQNTINELQGFSIFHLKISGKYDSPCTAHNKLRNAWREHRLTDMRHSIIIYHKWH
jgi:hypothetical protein